MSCGCFDRPEQQPATESSPAVNYPSGDHDVDRQDILAFLEHYPAAAQDCDNDGTNDIIQIIEGTLPDANQDWVADICPAAGHAVYAVGYNQYGQLGTGPLSDVQIGNVSQVSAGEYHSLALLSEGTVRAWSIWMISGFFSAATAARTTRPTGRAPIEAHIRSGF